MMWSLILLLHMFGHVYGPWIKHDTISSTDDYTVTPPRHTVTPGVWYSRDCLVDGWRDATEFIATGPEVRQ